MKFLLDADMPKSTADIIRSFGYDVEDVRDIGLGAAKDKEIIEYALKNERIVVTRDTDFGEVLRYPKHPGAIIFRLPYTFIAEKINERVKKFFETVDEKDIKNTIIIVELTRYRRRPL